MIDPDAVMTSYLMGRAALAVLAGNRIYAGVDLPAGYAVGDGPALLFAARGGGHLNDSSKVFSLSYQFRAYGETEVEARELDRALFDALNDAKAETINWARLEVFGQLVKEPSTGWPYVLTFYRVAFNNLG